LKDVSCTALGQFFRRAEAEGIAFERLTQGVPYSLKHLQNKHERIEWSVFVDFMDNAGRIWNEEQLADIGGAWIRSPFFRAFAVVARLLFNARDAYRFINKADSGAGNQVFACIRPTHIEVGPYHVVLEMRLPDDYARSRAFWVTTKGGLAAIPQLMALKPARVELQETPWGARYDIFYPRGGAWLAWAARLVTWPFTLRTAARELKEANEVLKARYAELDEARGVLALQATQLTVAHTISQLIHRDLDISRTLQAMAEALVNAGNYVCAEVHLSAVVDGKLLELRASQGEQLPTEPIVATVQSRGRVMGDVRVWHAPEHDPRERGQLLEFVLPTLSMALDNAISYRELAQYRDSLELRVAERTAELVQARDQLAQTVRSLEEAQEVRDRIFANINHEIRTPLTLVHLAVSDVKQRHGGALDARTLQQLDGIEMSTRKLLRLVDDLLILASGREGKLRLAVTAVDLAPLIDVIVATWRPVAEQKGISIAFHGPKRCVRNVDEEKIERVVTNLISNAIKFTPSGGSVQVDLTDDVRGVSVHVRDTGIGIDDDLKKRLFGRFEQGRPAVHAGARGSGIGLSIVKELIEAHGGEVSVENPRGGGSVFRVLLPAGAQPRAALGDADSGGSSPLRLVPDDFDSGRSVATLPRVLEPPAGTPAVATVLVAEDDPRLTDAIGALLSQRYRVILAGDGLTALRMAQQHMPDILVSDVGMPGMDGLELTRRFRELPGNRLAPVVLLTAFANLSDRLQGFGAGAIDYVVKPFEPAELLARVHSQLELRSLALRLHQSEKLAALGTLSAGLAHEMRNPANAIVNAIEPLSELLPSELRQEDHPVAQLVGVLRECSTQIALLSRQLLGFRRPGELEYQRTTVSDVFGRAHALTSQLFKSVTLEEELAYKGPLECAAPLLTQVLSNLLENGAHAAGTGGWVKLASRTADDRVVL
jgi:signal transduction histidine kinase